MALKMFQFGGSSTIFIRAFACERYNITNKRAKERKSESKNDTRERKNFFANDNSLTSLSSFVFK